jgi:hypothetical protein
MTDDTIIRIVNGGIIRHLGGVPWYEHPSPWRWHRCWVASLGMGHVGDLLEYIERCPCGGHRSAELYRWTEEEQHGLLDIITDVHEAVFGGQLSAVRWRARNTRRQGRATFAFPLLG